MNEGIHLDLDTWIVPGQIRKANLCRGLGNSYTPAGTEVLISAVAHNTPPPFQAAQNATTVNTRSSVAPCTAQRHTSASPECYPGVKRIGTSHRDFVSQGTSHRDFVSQGASSSHRWGQQTPATISNYSSTIWSLPPPLLLGVYSVRLLTRTTSLQRGPLIKDRPYF